MARGGQFGAMEQSRAVGRGPAELLPRGWVNRVSARERHRATSGRMLGPPLERARGHLVVLRAGGRDREAVVARHHGGDSVT